ncbi:MAG: tetratricopeptide repeat protein [Candidatus Melainabacteria bacterium]|nr:tetratricopeptide repeat protein [Candidatus Melainabacteria bacterium]
MKCDTIPDLEKFLKIQEQALGESSAEVATTASKLADLYALAERFDEAERLLKRALTIQQNLVGFHHDDVEKTRQSLEKLNDLKSTGKQVRLEKSVVKSVDKTVDRAVQATPAASRNQAAQTVRPSASGTKFGAMPEVTSPRPTFSNSKTVEDAIKETEIELELLKQMVGAEHPSVADLLTKLADLYCRLRMYSQMEPVLVDALKIREAACGSSHPSVSTELKNLARLYLVQERFALAEPLFKRALAIREKVYGRMHPRVADIEEQYAQLLRKTNRAYLAETLDQHVNAIRAQHIGDAASPRKTSMFNGPSSW